RSRLIRCLPHRLCRGLSWRVGNIDVLTQDVLRLGQVTHADDHDLAQSPGKRRLPSYRVGVIEPALRERRRIEQHAIDIDQLTPPPGAESFDHVREFGTLLLLDERYASHCSVLFRPARLLHLETGRLYDRGPAL